MPKQTMSTEQEKNLPNNVGKGLIFQLETVDEKTKKLTCKVSVGGVSVGNVSIDAQGQVSVNLDLLPPERRSAGDKTYQIYDAINHIQDMLYAYYEEMSEAYFRIARVGKALKQNKHK